VTHQLVDRTRELAAFDVTDEDPVERTDDRPGKRLDPVAVHDDEVHRILRDVVAQTFDRVREHAVHHEVGVVVLVEVQEDLGEPVLLDLFPRSAVLLQQVHPGGEDRVEELVAGVDGSDDRLELAVVRPGAGHEQDAAGTRGGPVCGPAHEAIIDRAICSPLMT